jgi:transcriptional regulator
MYVPRPFVMTPGEVSEHLTSMQAGHLVTATPSGLFSTFIPLVYDAGRGRHGALLGHVSRPNDQWRQKVIGEALVIAEGANGYISPSWYASTTEHGRVVPTWDYVVLHVHGALTVHDDVAFVRDVVNRLTERFEASSARPWHVTDAPSDYIERQLQAIVGIELAITRVEGSAKLSQNRPSADVDGLIGGLREGDEAALADEVERHRRTG